MNFPPLEICQDPDFAKEFEGSEFVYVSDQNGFFDWEYQGTNPGEYIDTRGKANRLINVLKYTVDQEKVKIIAPAPTCEELGDWLFSHDGQLHRSGYKVWDFSDNWDLQEIKPFFNAENETTARAEAVKLIIKERKNEKI